MIGSPRAQTSSYGRHAPRSAGVNVTQSLRFSDGGLAALPARYCAHHDGTCNHAIKIWRDQPRNCRISRPRTTTACAGRRVSRGFAASTYQRQFTTEVIVPKAELASSDASAARQLDLPFGMFREPHASSILPTAKNQRPKSNKVHTIADQLWNKIRIELQAMQL